MVVFWIILSNSTSNAGNTKATMARDRRVPLPKSKPSSDIIGLFEVKASANPADASIIADEKIATRLLLMV